MYKKIKGVDGFIIDGNRAIINNNDRDYEAAKKRLKAQHDINQMNEKIENLENTVHKIMGVLSEINSKLG